MGATIGTLLMTWWKGKLVGRDGFGNRYYQRKGGKRRWVIYKGRAEASKVPAEWHSWLHKTVDAPPTGDAASGTSGAAWQQDHQPNLTGTRAAYRPSGSLLEPGSRPAATGDYEAWRPEN